MAMWARTQRLVLWASAIASGLGTVAWVASYFERLGFACGVEYTWPESLFRDELIAGVVFEPGRVRVCVAEDAADAPFFAQDQAGTPAPTQFFFRSHAAERGRWVWWSWNRTTPSVGGLGIFRYGAPPDGSAYTHYCVPFYMLVAVASGPLVVAMVRGVRRRRRGMCPRCAYDLAGLTDGSPCPECGRAMDSRYVGRDG